MEQCNARDTERRYVMFDYDSLGAIVYTLMGQGRFLQHKNGKVLVVMDIEEPPVEFDASEVWI
jgi:hypothetical protein